MIHIAAKIYYTKITVEILLTHMIGKQICVICSNTVWEKSYIKGVVDGLGERCILSTFTHINPDAPFTDLEKIVKYFQGQAPDTIIAIGGGSVTLLLYPLLLVLVQNFLLVQ